MTPAVLLGTALVATAAGTGVSMYGQYQAGQSQKQLLEHNARMNLLNAQQAEAETRERIRRAHRRNRQFAERQRAAYAAAGVTDEGSPLTVMADTIAQQSLQARDIGYEGALEARNFRTQASYDMFRKRSISRAQPYQLGGTLLSGVNRAATVSMYV